jgi:RHS repeat-associated protein
MLSRIAGTSYRYGFNGQETDNEVKGFQNQQDYGMRIYDPRIGRFLSVDPVMKDYESPYSAFGNNPINIIDPDGADTISLNRTTTIRHFKGSSDGHSDNLVTPSRAYMTESGEIVITKAEGNDVFRIVNTTINVDENGNQTVTSVPTTLELNDPQAFFRRGRYSMSNKEDDRMVLAHHAPRWLLNYYANKSRDIGIRSTIALQKDFKALPYITAFATIAEIVFTGGLSGWFSSTGSIGFNSMKEFTGVYGAAPKGMNWHHFVEQRLAKNGTFSPQLIYSTENSILIQSGKGSSHTAISAYYSSIRKFTDGQTVRKWIEKKSFEEQLKFGKDIYNRVMNGTALP